MTGQVAASDRPHRLGWALRLEYLTVGWKRFEGRGTRSSSSARADLAPRQNSELLGRIFPLAGDFWPSAVRMRVA